MGTGRLESSRLGASDRADRTTDIRERFMVYLSSQHADLIERKPCTLNSALPTDLDPDRNKDKRNLGA